MTPPVAFGKPAGSPRRAHTLTIRRLRILLTPKRRVFRIARLYKAEATTSRNPPSGPDSRTGRRSTGTRFQSHPHARAFCVPSATAVRWKGFPRQPAAWFSPSVGRHDAGSAHRTHYAQRFLWRDAIAQCFAWEALCGAYRGFRAGRANSGAWTLRCRRPIRHLEYISEDDPGEDPRGA